MITFLKNRPIFGFRPVSLGGDCAMIWAARVVFLCVLEGLDCISVCQTDYFMSYSEKCVDLVTLLCISVAAKQRKERY